MQTMMIEYGFCNFEVTIYWAGYTHPCHPMKADCPDDARGGWEIDFSAMSVIDGEVIRDKYVLANIEQKIIRKLEEENEIY